MKQKYKQIDMYSHKELKLMSDEDLSRNAASYFVKYSQLYAEQILRNSRTDEQDKNTTTKDIKQKKVKKPRKIKEKKIQ